MAKSKAPNQYPVWEPTSEELAAIRQLSHDGWTKEAVARLFGKSRFALRRNAEAEEVFNEGRDLLISKVTMKFVDAALAGNVTAMIFFLKAQAGWREPSNQDKQDAKKPAAQNESMKVDLTVMLQGKSDQELKSLEDAIQLLIAAGAIAGPGDAPRNPETDGTGTTRH